MRHAIAILPLLLVGCVPSLEFDTGIDSDAIWENDWFIASDRPDDISGVQGWSVGNVVPYGELTAYNDQTFYTHQYWGRVWVFDLGALWCNPCHALADYTESTYLDYAEYDLEYLTVINQNKQGQPPSVSEINKDWVDKHCIERTPVVADDGPYTRAAWPETTLPVVLVVDEQMVIQKRYVGSTATEENIRSGIEEVLGIGHVDEANEPCGH